MAVREFVVEFTLHSSFRFEIAIATMPFDSDIYFNDFVFSFFSLFIEVWYIFIQEIVQAFTGMFAFSSAVNEDKLKSRRTTRFG